jgi:hypothetical protein
MVPYSMRYCWYEYVGLKNFGPRDNIKDVFISIVPPSIYLISLRSNSPPDQKYSDKRTLDSIGICEIGKAFCSLANRIRAFPR